MKWRLCFWIALLGGMLAPWALAQQPPRIQTKAEIVERLREYEGKLNRFALVAAEVEVAKTKTLGPNYPEKIVTESRHLRQIESFRTEVKQSATFAGGTQQETDALYTYDGSITRSLTNGDVGNIVLGTKREAPETIYSLYTAFSGMRNTAGDSLASFIEDPSSVKTKVPWFSEFAGTVEREGETLYKVRFTTYDPANPAQLPNILPDGVQLCIDVYLNSAAGLWPAGITHTNLDRSLKPTLVLYERWATKWTDIDGIRVATEYVQEGNSQYSTMRKFTISDLQFNPESTASDFTITFPPNSLVYIVDKAGGVIAEAGSSSLGLLNDIDKNLNTIIEISDRKREEARKAAETKAAASDYSTRPTWILAAAVAGIVALLLAGFVMIRSRRSKDQMQ